jgi:hypothetical protein
MSVVSVVPSPSSRATQLERATATRRTRDESPYVHEHAAFAARLIRAPPPLAGDGLRAIGTNPVPTPPTPVAGFDPSITGRF